MEGYINVCWAVVSSGVSSLRCLNDSRLSKLLSVASLGLKWQTCHFFLHANAFQKYMWLKPVLSGFKSKQNYVLKYREFRNIGLKLQWLTEAKWSNSKRNDVWFENSGVSKNRTSVWKIGIPLYLLPDRTVPKLTINSLVQGWNTFFVLMPTIFS